MESRGTNGRARGARRSQGGDLRVLKLVQKTAHRRDSGPGEPQPAFQTRIVHQQAEGRGTIAAAGLEADAGFDELPLGAAAAALLAGEVGAMSSGRRPLGANSTKPAACWPGVSPVRPGWTMSLPQPGGRQKIAQHFSAGLGADTRRVPAGTKEVSPSPRLCRPCRDFYRRTVLPSAEALGYFRSSLRDCQRQARSRTFSRAVREHGSSQQRSVVSRKAAPLS